MVTISSPSYQPTKWNIFQKVWSDIAFTESIVEALVAVTSRTMPAISVVYIVASWKQLFEEQMVKHTLEMRHIVKRFPVGGSRQ